ncbi:crossover junction endodeoxyribonuclease RuvC [Candidatus Parcubacteria bacterium 4484_255]|nr:MAG: crossover junction endodeoxyribonuclease RuvC [Candidatus Parcubacteria bacterium 4484_255]
MIILGIDPGYAITGYAIIKVDSQTKLISLIDYGCILSSPKDIFSKRLLILYEKVEEIIEKYNPDKMAIEHIYFAKNVKTAVKVSEARGVIILAAVIKKIDVLGFTPLQVKQTLTGYGRASKNQIQQMVKNILKLKSIPRPDDAADALAIALTCAQTKSW